jgi:hypothetical protein
MQVIQKLRALLETGGHAIILENVNDQAPHVFANSPERWRELFEAAGFRLRHQIAYDYSPAIRAISAARSKLVPARQETPAKPMLAQVNGDGQNAIRRLRLMAQRVAVFVDDQVEGVLVRRQPTFRSVHAGFLFEAI